MGVGIEGRIICQVKVEARMARIGRIPTCERHSALEMLIGGCLQLDRTQRGIAALKLCVQIANLNDEARLNPEEGRTNVMIGLKHFQHMGAGLGCTNRVQCDLNPPIVVVRKTLGAGMDAGAGPGAGGASAAVWARAEPAAKSTTKLANTVRRNMNDLPLLRPQTI